MYGIEGPQGHSEAATAIFVTLFVAFLVTLFMRNLGEAFWYYFDDCFLEPMLARWRSWWSTEAHFRTRVQFSADIRASGSLSTSGTALEAEADSTDSIQTHALPTSFAAPISAPTRALLTAMPSQAHATSSRACASCARCGRTLEVLTCRNGGPNHGRRLFKCYSCGGWTGWVDEILPAASAPLAPGVEPQPQPIPSAPRARSVEPRPQSPRPVARLPRARMVRDVACQAQTTHGYVRGKPQPRFDPVGRFEGAVQPGPAYILVESVPEDASALR